MKAIALLEVQAMVAAITGLDAMVKAADVKLIHVEKRLGDRWRYNYSKDKLKNCVERKYR